MKLSLITLLAVLVAVNASPVVKTSNNEGTVEARGCCHAWGCGPGGNRCCYMGPC
ncbi:hypothetical protein K493DRAFT_17464 [Basidiobolus meristosporus CBS 931.73]|uniref:Uncharacterized protein n=1 Tax=Basidiobolus meristosporus CBS 931.73 TaxID=1314790 RepID=A0A1Y1YFE3_9FUNG|nr:hypothetical protein K493DRAFT_17464 [Basidiobolus meristosporus CBS 931.73]|eukprot:ORX96719.1 hypothetical protein K493DRAFT_17464 [Basidiobolus meristosporus CBS 931.73]